MKRVPLTLLCTLLFSAFAITANAEVRKWTSAADPSKTFDGELVAVSETEITVKRADGQVMTFPLAVVSAEDQAYAKKNAASLPLRKRLRVAPFPGRSPEP